MATVVAKPPRSESGSPARAEAVQLVGVPAEVQHRVERLHVGDLPSARRIP